jgi:PHD/YefM family antitoxin component YafN of YafNO toxin-antitoxin module
MMNQITANDLKVKGISAIDEFADENGGVIITVRGKKKYIVLPIEEYNHLREYELEAAIIETRKDIAKGRVFKGTVEEHMKRVVDV